MSSREEIFDSSDVFSVLPGTEISRVIPSIHNLITLNSLLSTMNETDSTLWMSEAFSSLQGEGGTVRGSCFGKRQIFLRLAGCNLANGAFGSEGCRWCDSPGAKSFRPKTFECETAPGTQEMVEHRNPFSGEGVADLVEKLTTPDLHSLSFTGGEPTCQLDSLLAVAKALTRRFNPIPLYLETNGSILPSQDSLDLLGTYFSYCCVDLKDRSAGATSDSRWKALVETELAFIDALASRGVEVFAKLVVTSHTNLEDVRWIGKNLFEITSKDGQPVGLAIQPVTPVETDQEWDLGVSLSHLNEIFYTAARFLPPEGLTLSIQAHKCLNLL